MNNSNFNRALDLCVAAALLAGCGGAQLPIANPGTVPAQARMQSGAVASAIPGLKPTLGSPAYKAFGPLLYVASFDETLTPLRIYKANASDPKPIATINKDIDNSSGVCIDGDGTLYVTNDASPGWVSEYGLGHTKPLRVITKGINTPGYCAIDASGNLWVTNLGFNDVAEYPKGSTKPSATITKGLTYPVGVAIDHAGNLYVSNPEPFSAPNVQVYAPGSKSPSRTITDGLAVPVGIAVDVHDTLYVTNATAPGTVEEYRSRQSKPYRTISDKLAYPEDVVVNRKGWLYVSDSGYTSGEQAILEFPPHSLKPSSREVTKGFFNPQGLAYYPPVLP